ncbi:tetratricopeptide repeat family protein [Lysobacter antibioticus]|jgi:tetratricopeptide (TPR) repeat protein|uniref:hypothetical protein n=1 Tax=Lysobacter antibioticus TaxID=84531 RepID=UPI000721E78F|nr:hypothetical protein [Lysobacter antibioticus]ALN64977.1 tetratricopeptide repeat family protein [Lysobacter antibioticus]
MHMEMNALDDVESQVLDLANQAIGHQAGGDYRQAAQRWAQAIALADTGMHDDEIRYWLRSGIADAHYRLGQDEACIAAAREARDWCRHHQAPLAALLLGQALYRSGRVQAALEALEEARSMIGAEFLDAIDHVHRDAIAELMTARAA